ncbi:MAG: DUF4349 domain-containing protein [Chitinispirillia bacterium]|nr:DUF4349 domain-containing protein [Chitinispirillia bacterium]MCL2268505.1 DUF4349 domain-containing protein [Chitinispirillia bacterium]
MVLLSTALFSCAANKAPNTKADYAFEAPPDIPSHSEPMLDRSRALSASAPSQIRGQAETWNAGRMMTYSLTQDLVVKNTDETKKALIAQVITNRGFIVGERDRSVTARIPVENMDRFAAYARTLGKVEYETKRGTDITDQYRDNTARMNNLKRVRDRYLALLERAEAISDILSIEKELERISSEIEVLEGRIRHSEQSVAFSIITVSFREKTTLGPLGWVFYGLYRGVGALFVWD